MNPLKIIEKYYKKDSKAYHFLVLHSKAVTKKALDIAKLNNGDLKFIEEAAMLHDIGIFKVKAPQIGCLGSLPYICHGYLGRGILESEDYPKHALVCERHVGTGLSKDKIIKEKLPIPQRDMIPTSKEEQIICLADKFFSKNKEFLEKEKSLKKIRSGFLRFGKKEVEKFDELYAKFIL
jgi:uncharacterized protein